MKMLLARSVRTGNTAVIAPGVAVMLSSIRQFVLLSCGYCLCYPIITVALCLVALPNEITK